MTEKKSQKNVKVKKNTDILLLQARVISTQVYNIFKIRKEDHSLFSILVVVLLRYCYGFNFPLGVLVPCFLGAKWGNF